MKTRILSICVLVPIFISCAYLGGYPYLAMILLICGICAWEFARIYDCTGEFRIPLILSVVCVEILIIARYFLGVDASHRTLTFCIITAMIWGIWACEHEIPHSAVSFAVLTSDMVYIGWLGGYMISNRMQEDGFVKLMLIVSMVWTNDSFAYLVGRKIGKHKISKHVSPRKSWEGAIGGVVFTVLLAILAERFIPAVSAILNMKQIIILSLMVSIVGPLGDLGESMIKRSFGVKDSSHLIPGHGGFFDRFDAMFFAMPIGYYFFELIIHRL